ncbi:hypothetical protein CABS01_09559 [Colletotrichum abscissum]|uniref:Uncharacterized protein n=1 Tax=Colletotrichum abscissum TaxID=1671311 RepID=A0A9Q0B7K3_9PEZI|nr:uncharacterized protein CABS01_09559 [Colletotrichum abscissum]KAI3558200.1 hypothetical protein CABS02_01347 [Colletotrichum abscissum]KAK1501828.1 hypothetical protein CABS01_09559 [Colletotrichum abscissum]
MSRLLIATQQQLPASHASPERPRSHFSLQDVHDLPPRQPRSTFLAVGSPFTHHPNNRSTHSLPHASSPVSPLPQTFVSCYHQRQYVPPIYFPMRHHHLSRNLTGALPPRRTCQRCSAGSSPDRWVGIPLRRTTGLATLHPKSAMILAFLFSSSLVERHWVQNLEVRL